MKSFSIPVICLLVMIGCTRSSTRLPSRTPSERIEFGYEPSFEHPWVVSLERDSRGNIAGEVYQRVSEGFANRDQRRSFQPTPAIFDELVRNIESEEFKDAAEHFPMSGIDGVAYVFRHHMGNRSVELRIWGPTVAPEIPSAKLALHLSKKFMSAANIHDLSEFREKPNQAPEPTAPSGRGSP